MPFMARIIPKARGEGWEGRYLKPQIEHLKCQKYLRFEVLGLRFEVS
jgi:hypothetical protein